MKGFVLAGTASGVGKTVTTLAVIRGFQAAGYDVQPAKAGPDFIDPTHHQQVAEKPSRTLDVWLEGVDGTRRNYYRGDGDVCVVEGVMGLYDGEKSSTAMVADALELPVVLVVDAAAGMESVAATALGFREFADRTGVDIDVTGVIANRAHGGRHERGIRNALPEGLAYYGRVPPHDQLEIPDRHLGLEMGDEVTYDGDALDAAAEHIRTDALIDAVREPPGPAARKEPGRTGKRVAVASDAAFAFRYPATDERLRQRADVVSFAPTAGDGLPAADGVYLPGGYPELHAGTLADSPAIRSLADAAASGTAILGECGGFMVLAEALTTADGDTHEMAGVLPATVRMHDRYQALDHVELAARADSPIADDGQRLRGHEFHYSSADLGRDARFAFEMERGEGLDGDHDGLQEYRTLGTYCHFHAESGAFDAFIDSL